MMAPRPYRLLQRILLPREFREEFGEEMCTVVAEHWKSVRGQLGPVGATRFWIRQVFGLARSAVNLRRGGRAPAERRGSAPGRTPRYRSSREGALATIGYDVRAAARTLARRPGLSGLCVLVLGAGIGINTSAYSLVSGVLLRPLPFADSERLMVVREVPAENNAEARVFAGSSGEVHASPVTVEEWQRSQDVIELVGYDPRERMLAGEDPLVVRSAHVTTDFFRFLGEDLLFGVDPTAVEGEEPPPVVLGHALWRSRYGADAEVVGQSLELTSSMADDVSVYTIVGVARPRFDFPAGAQLWTMSRPAQVATGQTASEVGGAGNRGIVVDPAGSVRTVRSKTRPVLGRLREGVTLARAEGELSAIASSIPYNEGWRAQLTPLQDEVTRPIRPALLMLMAAVGLTLTIACANVGGLLLARGIARREELAVRSALGASRARLARGMLLEGLLLGVLGGGAGVALAFLATQALARSTSAILPRYALPGVDAPVLWFAVIVSLATGLLAALAPALGSATDLSPAIRENRGGTVRSRMRSALVVSEIALSVVLLAGAGLLLRSFLQVIAVDPGFRAAEAVAFELRMPRSLYSGRERWGFQEKLAQRVATLPGVVSAGTTRNLPMTGSSEPNPIIVEGREAESAAPAAQTTAVSADYFRAMEIELLRGRYLEAADSISGWVAVVNETFARTFFPNDDAIGRRVRRAFGGTNYFEIVGVVRDVRQTALMEPPGPQLYTIASQDFTQPGFHLVVRSSLPLSVLAPAVRSALADVEPDAIIPTITPLEELLSRSAARPRFYALSLGTFAAVALALALFGLYGVLSQMVAERRGEVAVRVVLGAQSGQVIALFLRRGLGLVLAGLALGLAGALATTRLLSAVLFGVDPLDPATFAGVAALLLGTALLATLVPARAAATAQPAEVLAGS
jgi:putative ABC transport system permease protein